MKFTYLDLVDSSIDFLPVMRQNSVETTIQVGEALGEAEIKTYRYSLFNGSGVPGYLGQRCVIEEELAQQLKVIQKKLQENGPYTLKVFDAYRPTQAVESFCEWGRTPEDPIVKKFHHPNILKAGFNDLTFLARRSSHSRGSAVDLTISTTDESKRDHKTHIRPKEFLGLYNPDELDMGVGYLAFDQRSSHYFSNLTLQQSANRELLTKLMLSNGFVIHPLEFWHYFYKTERNKDIYFNFPIKDDYPTTEDGIIIFPHQ